MRLTGKHETASIDTFSWGVADPLLSIHDVLFSANALDLLPIHRIGSAGLANPLSNRIPGLLASLIIARSRRRERRPKAVSVKAAIQ
jgi:hypothetical protein